MFGLLKRCFAGSADSHRPNKARLDLEELEARQVPTLTPFAFASIVVNSAEHFTDFVTGEYARFLHRAPDPGGLSFFVTSMELGLSPEAVEAAFVSSNEYIFNHGNNVSLWLTGLYNDLLGRAPDSSGFNFWLNNLAAGETTGMVALGFATSPERDAIVISEDYSNFLGRAPDPNGMSHYMALMQAGFTRSFVASDIIGSVEFFRTHGNNDNGLVVATYLDVLSRVPTSTELSFWLSQLPPSPFGS
jgi:hypothetical protein